MSQRGARTARGLTAAAAATLLAGLSHSIGGGAGAQVPFGVGTVIAFAFAAMVCVALAGRTVSLARLAASVVLSQLAFHGLFAVSGSSLQVTTNPAAHHDASVHLLNQIESGGSIEAMGQAGHLSHGGTGMIVAHVFAAVITIAALHSGERAMLAILRAAGRLIAVLVAGAPRLVPVVEIRLSARALVLLPRDLLVVLSSMRHRGPPRSTALRLA
ncbi:MULTISPECIES: hypothetical protein [unclassified Leifsonia]|uniref:hypothetical protein n=1 Tax=unclassified Leifsonia TaxID=2663824 RepID=UPI0006F7E786|nr:MULTISPECIES: hypothetical protein [unclassified Leifsonia]KQX08073.1 hypothetical protein ASC59_10345 [Leifsonia sp. Root1293]KRA12354.1 hypothetical protein ASD61_10345 [Leifsonia sp. Root60]